jgi:mRNA interferase RelE/StbE
MRYRLEIGEEALGKLRGLPREIRRNIGHRLDLLQDDLCGDVRKLADREAKYRLRIGSFRVLFTIEKDLIFVYDVKDRKDAYRD